jgi:hypothetical protein
MASVTSNYVAEFNCIARGTHLGSWDDLIPNDIAFNDLLSLQTRLLRRFWRERDGELEPIIQPSEQNPIPDEVIIRRDGRIVCRRTIVDEMNVLYAKRYA